MKLAIKAIFWIKKASYVKNAKLKTAQNATKKMYVLNAKMDTTLIGKKHSVSNARILV